ncbi:transcription elongation factor GreA [Tessaracoccus sp. MC1865]|uniref:transcription elongation factor GreA n=1 Tax=Tessaracoccus sp. MC1865 TaxID=2760310 RepID=UPI0016010BC2|nr:transcription elongation factor GreA [Tessaracoccus sp. MC1865]MBB1482392.1 transcription elongation factor GreA [Tessaracoccus sp. MC1865]QTO38145.1 transcription elongation factor GreA [Tessaracoccus sp. MC1865]
MSETATDVVWLTQEAYDKLEAELNELRTVGREEVTARIAAAREEGDLSENGGYHAAREEQGQMEGRIRQLEDLLRRAQVGEPEGAADEVAPGKIITVAYDGDDDDTDTFLLGSREVLGTDDSVEFSVFSPQSPMGSAILGARVGDEVRYTAPNGKELMVRITKVSAL